MNIDMGIIQDLVKIYGDKKYAKHNDKIFKLCDLYIAQYAKVEKTSDLFLAKRFTKNDFTVFIKAYNDETMLRDISSGQVVKNFALNDRFKDGDVVAKEVHALVDVFCYLGSDNDKLSLNEVMAIVNMIDAAQKIKDSQAEENNIY